MCGIVGLVDLERRLSCDELRALTQSMNDAIAHRGPDDEGVWIDARHGVGLGHRRLSVIDLSEDGRQPMSAEGSSTTVTYNGEIYNFEELRARLSAQGRRFRSRSDTEILPYLFDELDPSALGLLGGMFAFGAWNGERAGLMLARDAFGKKPLYVYQDSRFFAFASEVQCFYALPGFDPELDPEALADYLLLGYVPAPRSIYRRVRQLEPGSWETWTRESSSVRRIDAGRFFRFAAHSSPAPVDERVVKARLKAELVRAVEARTVADVPLGAFLSGGVDSALVVAVLRRELGREIDTFSIGFDGSPESEHEAAQEIADNLGARHHCEMLKPNGLEMVAEISEALDQPNGDSSCLPTYLLSGFARRHVTVCLSGDGGDELFGGYGRYRDTLNDWSDKARIRANLGLDPETARPSDVYMSLRWHVWLPDAVTRFLGGMPAASEARLADWRGGLDDEAAPLLHRMRNLDVALYLHGAVLAKVDRMSMRHALEVRCPLLDVRFAELAMGLDASHCWAAPDVTKRLLKDIASDYLPSAWMHRPKRGFGLPSAAWSHAAAIDLCRGVLLGGGSALASHLDADEVARVVEHQAQPGCFSIYQMWPLLVLELWLRAQRQKIARAQASHAVRLAA